VKAVGKSHVGKVRSSNQDSWMAYYNEATNQYVAAVADGMGGHRAGNLASRMALDEIRRTLFAEGGKDDPVRLAAAIDAANGVVYAYAQANEDAQGMGTTVVMLLTDQNGGYIANVGDSRAYIFHAAKRKFIRLSRDHSLVQELLDCGRIDESEAMNHPQKNIITRAVGTASTVAVDVLPFAWHQNDVLLLCSDGLCGYVPDDVIAQIMAENARDAEACAQRLVDAALETGGMDNVTVVLVHNEGGVT
jgi:serine/threonine protein phosphatase PrpC